MHTGAGVALIVSSSVLLAAVAFVLHRRAPAALTAVVAAVAGFGLGAGALLVQVHASAAEWVLAAGGLTLLAPLHLRVVFGPFGRRRADVGRARPAAG